METAGGHAHEKKAWEDNREYSGTGDPPDELEIIAILVKLRYIRTFEEYLALTHVWIEEVLFHARDKDGNIKIRPKPKTGKPRRDEREQWIWERRNLLGWPEWYIRQELKEWDRIYQEQAERRRVEWEARVKRAKEARLVKRHEEKAVKHGNRKKSNRRGRTS